MLLDTLEWGSHHAAADRIVCIHGLTQHAGVYSQLGEQQAAHGQAVLAVSLRGHGGSGVNPPWSLGTHVDDVLETIREAGIERATIVGHSFGGIVAAALAAKAPREVDALALLETPGRLPPQHALRAIEIERLDWSFATIEGAIEAMMSGDVMTRPPRDVVTAFVKDDVRRGPDGRYRFRFSRGASVVAWNEMTMQPPEIANLPTLLVRAASPLVDVSERTHEYEATLGDQLTMVEVPNGHNVLWEAPTETLSAVDSFIKEVRG